MQRVLVMVNTGCTRHVREEGYLPGCTREAYRPGCTRRHIDQGVPSLLHTHQGVPPCSIPTRVYHRCTTGCTIGVPQGVPMVYHRYNPGGITQEVPTNPLRREEEPLRRVLPFLLRGRERSLCAEYSLSSLGRERILCAEVSPSPPP